MKSRTVTELLAWQPLAVPEIISDGILQPGGRMVIFGRTGTWKSMLGIHTGFCISAGLPWLGFKTVQSRVLMAQVEIPEVQLRRRVEKYVNSNGQIPADFHLLSEPFLRLDQSMHTREFEMLLASVKPQVVILDPLYRMTSIDISKNHELEQFMDIIDRLAVKHNLATILISHTIKQQLLDAGQQRDWIQDAVGGSYLVNWADTMIAVEPVTDTVLDLHFLKVRAAEDEIGIVRAQVDRSTLHFKKVII